MKTTVHNKSFIKFEENENGSRRALPTLGKVRSRMFESQAEFMKNKQRNHMFQTATKKAPFNLYQQSIHHQKMADLNQVRVKDMMNKTKFGPLTSFPKVNGIDKLPLMGQTIRYTDPAESLYSKFSGSPSPQQKTFMTTFNQNSMSETKTHLAKKYSKRKIFLDPSNYSRSPNKKSSPYKSDRKQNPMLYSLDGIGLQRLQHFQNHNILNI